MSRATCWSMLALAVAFWNFAMHRDISANMYIAAFFAIQGCRFIPDEKPTRQWRHVVILCTLLSVAICLFAAQGMWGSVEWVAPKSW